MNEPLDQQRTLPLEDVYYERRSGGRRESDAAEQSPGCIAVIVALAVVVGGFYFAVTKGVDFVRDQFADPADYAGPGQGKVTFQVESGDTVAEMGRGLKDAGVVASVQAFINAAAAEPGASGIQVGFYQFKKEMAAADAVDILLDPENILRDTVTIPEGLRVDDILDVLAKNTDFSREQYQKVLDDPERIGLPDYAEGNPEGYLFPSTYDLGPDATPESILAAMVDRWQQAAEDADLEGRAAELGYTPHELMTVASLVEAEAAAQRGPRQGRAGDLQPARPATRPTDCSRSTRPSTTPPTSELGARSRRRGPQDRLALQHLPERRACHRDRSRHRVTPRSWRRPTRPRATGTTT